MTDITEIFGGKFTPPPKIPETAYTAPPEQQMIDAIAGAGYTPPSTINFDGKVHRFSSDGRKRGDSGWYVAYDGKIAGGCFGCWKDSSSINWRQDMGRKLNPFEDVQHRQQMKSAREQAESERRRRQETAAGTVATIWSQASEASDDHPYLIKKGVSSHGLRVSGDGRLIVPMIDANGEISSIQYIPTDGDKQYHPGGAVAGCRFTITGQGETQYIAEGYATAASIHEATGATVHVAFSAGQLAAVTETIRHIYQGDLVIVADNDASGVGQESAQKAAKEYKARVIVPPVVGMDANDYEQSGHDLSALLNPPADDWLIPADEFASEPAPIKWLIKHHIQRGALHMIHGPSGGGKTFAVLDQCCHIASGIEDWCGNRVRPGAVVYLAGEGHHGMRGRVKAWMQYNRIDSLDMWISKAGTDLNTPEGYNKVRQALMSLPVPPVVVVVDTLHRFLHGDENSAQDAKTMLDACNALQSEFECAAVLVHHTGVSDDAQHRARGSSAWKGALDIEISVIPGSEDAPMQWVQRKMKDGELQKPLAMRITSVELPWIDEDGEPVTSAVVVQDEDWEPESKGESKAHAKARSIFENAWRKFGEISQGLPYLTESAWREFHRESNAEMKDGTRRSDFKRSKDYLIESGYILANGAGFSVAVGQNSAALMMLKK